MKYFQLMSGDSSRDFSKVMLDFGVAIVGPGDPGPITTKKDYYIEKGEWAKLSWLEEAEEGTRIVLHSGQSTIQAVGEVRIVQDSAYHHSEFFADIDGWDMQHFCYVNWKDLKLNLEGRPLSRATVQRLHIPDVIAQIEARWPNAADIPAKHQVTESNENDLSNDQIEQHLISLGLRIEDAENTIETISRVEKLAKWYNKNSESVTSTEHEVRSFVVVPLLYALGWAHQKMAVERDKLDILVFRDANRKHPKILFETKTMWSGSLNAIQQVVGYLESKKELLTGLEKVVVTDGLTYWLFRTDDLENPVAHMNLMKKKLRNPAYPDVGGFLDFVKEIIPGQ